MSNCGTWVKSGCPKLIKVWALTRPLCIDLNQSFVAPTLLHFNWFSPQIFTTVQSILFHTLPHITCGKMKMRCRDFSSTRDLYITAVYIYTSRQNVKKDENYCKSLGMKSQENRPRVHLPQFVGRLEATLRRRAFSDLCRHGNLKIFGDVLDVWLSEAHSTWT